MNFSIIAENKNNLSSFSESLVSLDDSSHYLLNSSSNDSNLSAILKITSSASSSSLICSVSSPDSSSLFSSNFSFSNNFSLSDPTSNALSHQSSFNCKFRKDAISQESFPSFPNRSTNCTLLRTRSWDRKYINNKLKSHLIKENNFDLAKISLNQNDTLRKRVKSFSSFSMLMEDNKNTQSNAFGDICNIYNVSQDSSSNINILGSPKNLYLQNFLKSSSAIGSTDQSTSTDDDIEQQVDGNIGWQSLHKKILRYFNEKSGVMSYMDKISAHSVKNDNTLQKQAKRIKKEFTARDQKKKKTINNEVKYVKIEMNEKLCILNNSVCQDYITAAIVVLALVELRRRWQIRFPDISEEKCLIMREKDINLASEEGVSTEPLYNPYLAPILPKAKHVLTCNEGVFRVQYHSDAFINRSKTDINLICMAHPTVCEFLSALKHIMTAVQMPICKAFCYERLKYIEQIFSLHLMFNSSAELQEIKHNVHRDFYNVRKVDTHVHHSACMQQKHLLRFIRKKYRTEKHQVVAVEYSEKDKISKHLTLEEIFQRELGVNAYDASVDRLDVHALGSCFQRFDLFNLKYNPFGHKILRDVFLKTDNYNEGCFLAEITREVMDDLEENKYENVEWRISIYGKSYDEWSKLANWIVNNKLNSARVRWLIQVPRLYYIYRKIGLISNFGEMLRNIFLPVFEAVLNPEKFKNIFYFLQQIVGWDSVDDESHVSKYTMKGGNLPLPNDWTSSDNPPYSYYAYYMYSNILTLNQLLFERGLKTLSFRPHCGEAGSISHLASMYILASSINHGIILKKTPVLMYLYYLKQIGLALSPLSNNALFLDIAKSPLYSFFKIGMNVSLSTDDPLMFHFTNQPLLEEYSIAAHVWKLSPVDLCELARNSVLQSGYEVGYKRHWIGDNYMLRGSRGNNILKTNLPNIRLQFREDTLKAEYNNLFELASLRNMYKNGGEDEQEDKKTNYCTSVNDILNKYYENKGKI